MYMTSYLLNITGLAFPSSEFPLSTFVCTPHQLPRGAVGSFDSALGYLVAFGFCHSDVVLTLKGKCWVCLLRLVIAPFSFVLPGLHDFSLGRAQLHKSGLFVKIKSVSKQHDVDRAKNIRAPNAGCCPLILCRPPLSDILKEAFSRQNDLARLCGNFVDAFMQLKPMWQVGLLRRSLVKHSPVPQIEDSICRLCCLNIYCHLMK